MYDEAFIEYIQAEKRFSPLTVEAYRRDIEQFAGYLLEVYETDDLTEVNTAMAKAFVVWLKEKNMENRSINRKI